mgnify:CR=1 FL=1
MQQINDWYGRSVTVGVAADHGGFEKKNWIREKLQEQNIKTVDLGPLCYDRGDDYPIFACALARELSLGNIDCGILLCTTGIGMSIAANRFHGVRAALVSDVDRAKTSRSHNAANVLVTGDSMLSQNDLLNIVTTWLGTPFSNDERHIRRLTQIETDSYDEVAPVRNVDPEMAVILDNEKVRQDEGIELIASENFASPAVRAATASVLTNKYAEGYPRKRYYNGCEFVDDAEELAIKRACELFGAEAANVQPHSGSQANMAVYFALLQPGDKVLAMSLAHGGHLTHGLKVNFSGRFYDFYEYGVDRETETLDYDNISELARENKPKMIMAGASAYPRTIDFQRLREIADEVDAYLVVDMAHIAGLVAAGVHPSPVPYADVVTSTTHKTLRGPRSGMILARQELIKKINSQIFPGIQGGPLMHVIAAKAVCFHEAMTNEFKAYQQQVVKNAVKLAAELENQNLRVVSGGTDNHLMLVDLRPKNITGKVAAEALDVAGITVNKNMIPFDPEKPTVTSGVRIGTPAVTTRGMEETEMTKIAEWIGQVLDNVDNEDALNRIRKEIAAFTSDYPLPQFQTA